MDYLDLAKIYESVESTTLKTQKASIISKYLTLSRHNRDIKDIILLLQGRIYPEWSEKEIGIASKLMISSISKAYGVPKTLVEEKWIELGDIGFIAETLHKTKRQSTLFTTELTIRKVIDNLRKIADTDGFRSQQKKMNLITELLTSASPLEARYITRTILGELRIGVAEGIIRDAIAEAFFTNFYWKELLNQKINSAKKAEHLLDSIEDQTIAIDQNMILYLNKHFPEKFEKFKLHNKIIIRELEENTNLEKKDFSIALSSNKILASELKSRIIKKIEHAHNVTNDFSEITHIAVNEGLKGLDKLTLSIDHPIKVMLYQKAKDIDDAFERVGRPARLEYKYDGFRIQAHSKNRIIQLFTRRLDNVTSQFPDIISHIKEAIPEEKDYIIDMEVIAYDPKNQKFLPFQYISRRIKRKYDIDQISEKVPVRIRIFDAMLIGSKNLLDCSLKERIINIKNILKETEYVSYAESIETDSTEKAAEFYRQSLDIGNEGIMAKNLEAPYMPGSRVGFGVKIKPVMETLDLVITAAEHGEGKRSEWFATFELSCKDNISGELLTIGKIGTGIKEKSELGLSFKDLTDMITPLIINSSNRIVHIKPSIVLEIAYEEIQKSKKYSSGFALRFPRLIRLRPDRSSDEISTLHFIEDLYNNQRSR